MSTKQNSILILILTIGVFSIINTEMGVIGILPMISEVYGVEISAAGMLVSLFALAVAISGPILPLLLSGFNRKYIMIIVLGTFFICNLISAFAENFTVVLITRVLPAFLHPVYISLAFSAASASVKQEDIPKATAKVMIGVSAGMVLGVPIISYIANLFSLEVAMLSFAAVNLAALLATCILTPSMPVKEKLSYGTQLSILKDKNLIISFIAVVFLNGGIFGAYSYLADYLGKVTSMSAEIIVILLLVYGLSNIVGNIIAGKMLTVSPLKFVAAFPFMLIAAYVIIFFGGAIQTVAMAMILIWGILAGIGANIHQYWIFSAAPQAPDFSNALFLVATNVGTSFGAFICGMFIDYFDINYILIGGIIFFIISVTFIMLRVSQQKSNVLAEQQN